MMSPRPRPRRFLQVDVFCDQPAKGNGLAVVVDADGLSTQQMQDFAAWTNLAETTFLLPPEDPAADYRVRILPPPKKCALPVIRHWAARSAGCIVAVCRAMPGG